jgi:N-acetylneuraminic acid mutarotase
VTISLHPAGRRRFAVAAMAGVLTIALGLPALATAATAGTARGLGPPNTWVPTGSMAGARSGQTATTLRDGKILVAGGGTASAELYNPATRRFSPTGQMSVRRTDATATLLRDGDVLVAGGRVSGKTQLTSAELYHPATGTWSATGSMHVARSGQTATLLPDGEVLVAGGGCNGKSFYQCSPGIFGNSQSSAELYNPATGTWAFTGRMSTGRQYGTATLLTDGKVLVAGGRAYCDDGICVDTPSAQLYDSATGTWSAAGSMHNARERHTATLLTNGDVLVAGGINVSGVSGFSTPETAELYNPATGKWSSTAPMATDHIGQTATLLRNGWVLVAGGGTAVAEIYEPQRALWVTPGAMSTTRTGATATLLPDGHVLVIGGGGHDGDPQATAEEFLAGPGPLVTIAPTSVPFGAQQVGTTSTARSYRVTNEGSANLVVSGVALAGAHPGDFHAAASCAKDSVAPGGTCTVSVRFTPATTGLRAASALLSDNAPGTPQRVAVEGYGGGPDTWVPVGPMNTARDSSTATLLPDGKVLVAGGMTNVNEQFRTASAELYNPATRSFSPTGSLPTALDSATATLLRNGQVLVAGGQSELANLASAELYNPATGKWRSTAPMHQPGYSLTSTLLSSGKVLVTGLDFGRRPPEVYDPAKGTWTDTGPMKAQQWNGTATLLRDGKVLVAGGHGTDSELYNPGTNSWAATGSLKVGQLTPTATLLPDGEVLLAGGSSTGRAYRPLDVSELYNPATGSWSLSSNSLNGGRAGGAATLLPDSTVLLTGGCTGGCDGSLASSELYIDGNWQSASPMTQPRMAPTATLLHGGDVLVTGGDLRGSSLPTSTAELYTPNLLSVHPDSGPAGTRVTVSGSNFDAHQAIRVLWGNKTVAGHATTSASGAFTGKITIPAAKPGKYLVFAVGPDGTGPLTEFTVTG